MYNFLSCLETKASTPNILQHNLKSADCDDCSEEDEANDTGSNLNKKTHITSFTFFENLFSS